MQKKVRMSSYYLPLLKEAPGDAKLASHGLCLRAGLVKQCGSGIYTWLPLGFRVLQNIKDIVHRQLDRAGLIQMLMPCIQQAKIWQESGRYDDYGLEMLRINDRHDAQMLFGPTNEELMTHIIKDGLHSYKQLPKIFYHTQWKFRDEVRPRFGLMRAREFLMKDAYSFDIDEDSAKESYNKMYCVYLNIFKEIGVDVIPCKADAGAIGGNLNHEFHIVTKSGGESKIFYDEKISDTLEQFYAENEEGQKHILPKLQSICAAVEEIFQKEDGNSNIKEASGIEVGHIFSFGSKYSQPMKANFLDKNGNLKNLYMGSYGIGISRLVAAIIEASHDENGIIWPDAIAPFKIGLINLHNESANMSNEIFNAAGKSVLYDDTNDSPGVKFSRMDLIGLPIQIIVGKNSVETRAVEIKSRKTGKKKVVNLNELDAALFQSSLA